MLGDKIQKKADKISSKISENKYVKRFGNFLEKVG